MQGPMIVSRTDDSLGNALWNPRPQQGADSLICVKALVSLESIVEWGLSPKGGQVFSQFS